MDALAEEDEEQEALSKKIFFFKKDPDFIATKIQPHSDCRQQNLLERIPSARLLGGNAAGQQISLSWFADQ